MSPVCRKLSDVSNVQATNKYMVQTVDKNEPIAYLVVYTSGNIYLLGYMISIRQRSQWHFGFGP